MRGCATIGRGARPRSRVQDARAARGEGLPMGTAIATLVESRTRDLGGLAVRRVLPAFPQRMVGPFIFLDHMGPAHFDAGQGVDVRPHPHIGLATVTYLFAGCL